MDQFNLYVKQSIPNSFRGSVDEFQEPHLTSKMGPMGRAIITSIAEIYL
jgi:hypothetical protein